MSKHAPSATELEANAVVQAAFAVAWADSFPDDPSLRHEEGGWIFLNELDGTLVSRRARPGYEFSITLDHPPDLPGYYLVAMFHTHPNPTEDGWLPEPSRSDRQYATMKGVPNFVVSDAGIYRTGPDRRVGGDGPRGYPL